MTLCATALTTAFATAHASTTVFYIHLINNTNTSIQSIGVGHTVYAGKSSYGNYGTWYNQQNPSQPLVTPGAQTWGQFSASTNEPGVTEFQISISSGRTTSSPYANIPCNYPQAGTPKLPFPFDLSPQYQVTISPAGSSNYNCSVKIVQQP